MAQSVLMNEQELTALLIREFPQIAVGEEFVVESVGPMRAVMRLRGQDKHLRPGGTISGPSMFALADVCLYVAIMAQIGPQSLTVTTNLNINFLRLPGATDLVADCKILKLGKRLAIGECSILPAGGGELVAHATATYSIPPVR
jgi:uncharacterized protein (TIGR00369 family)